MKKFLATLVAVILCICLTGVSALAQSTVPKADQAPAGRPMGSASSPALNGEEPPEKPDGDEQPLEKPEGDEPPPQGTAPNGQMEAPTDGSIPEPPDGIYIASMRDTLAALEDSEVGETLLGYLTAYEQALSAGKDHDQADEDDSASDIKAASEALLSALTSAGVSLTSK